MADGIWLRRAAPLPFAGLLVCRSHLFARVARTPGAQAAGVIAAAVVASAVAGTAGCWGDAPTG